MSTQLSDQPTGADTIRRFYDRLEARDWAALAELLADDVIVDWPVSRERFVGRENYIAANAEYPEGWSIRVMRIVGDGSDVAAEVEVPFRDEEIFRAASFWTVQNGRITRGVEYYTTFGAETPAEWRAAYGQRY